jgi:hypothetical protein
VDAVSNGYNLVLNYYGCESYDFGGTAVFFPWFGEGPVQNKQCGMTASSKVGTQGLYAEWVIPGNTVVNFRLTNAQQTNSNGYVFA